jgi:hypothetical protein
MKRSPSYNDLGETDVAQRGFHDLHYDAGTHTSHHPNSTANYSQSNDYPQMTIPGRWPGNSPPATQQTRPQQPPPQWTSTNQTSQSRPENLANQLAQNDFIDMPEPSLAPIPPPFRAPPRQEADPYLWNVGDDPARKSPYQTPGYGPLDNLSASLSATLPQYKTPPPPLPPKTPIGTFSSSPPPLPPRGHSPYQDANRRYSTNTPPRMSLRPDDPYKPPPSQSPPLPRPSTGHRLSPDLHYNPSPPAASSYSGSLPVDAPFFVPANQHSPSNQESYSNHSTPPRPDRYSPKPSPPNGARYSPPNGFNPPIRQSQPIPYQQPQQPQYRPPSIDSHRRPSPIPSSQKRIWRPTPPPQRPLGGPIVSTPPPTSMTDLRHLPYPPILLPPYHRETLDHPQHFAKSNLLKILIIPAENTSFLGGSEIYGRMELLCKGDGGGSKGKPELLIGELGIELTGYDGISPLPSKLKIESKSETNGCPPRSHLFLLSRRTFQTPFDKSAPLDKVTSAIAYPTTIEPDDAGYRQPAKANTIFPFRFQVPVDVGSAVECGQEVRTRYTLTGYAKVRILGSFETLIQSVEVSFSVDKLIIG